MSADARVALVGLPGTGKTTYLAALYNAFDGAGADAPHRLRRLPEHRLYLEDIRDAWLAGDSVPRTPIGTGELVRLEAVLDGTPADLLLPDVSGESFSDALSSRQIDSSLAQAVHDSAGILLFTDPNELRPRVPLARVQGKDTDPKPTEEDAATREFDFAATAPAETQLVDLLQWAGRLAPDRTVPLRAAVIVSMWDMLPTSTTPRMWLGQMPMLRQYAGHNTDNIVVEVFGVSAQGGSYGRDDDPCGRPPLERPVVVTPDGDRSSDVTLPLRWACST